MFLANMSTLFLIALLALGIIIGRRMWLISAPDYKGAEAPVTIFSISHVAHVGRNLFWWVPRILELTLYGVLSGLLHLFATLADVLHKFLAKRK